MKYLIIVAIILILLYIKGSKPSLDKNQQVMNQLMQMCNSYIEEFELGNIAKKPSCKNDLMIEIERAFKKVEHTLSDISPSEFDKTVLSTISFVSSEMLMSGRYHLYTGILNPMLCGEQLKRVYKNSMQAAVKRGYIDTETYKNHRDHVDDMIHTVG